MRQQGYSIPIPAAHFADAVEVKDKTAKSASMTVMAAECRGSGQVKTFSVGDSTTPKGPGYAHVGCSVCGQKFDARVIKSSGGIGYNEWMVRVPKHSDTPPKPKGSLVERARAAGMSEGELRNYLQYAAMDELEEEVRRLEKTSAVSKTAVAHFWCNECEDWTPREPEAPGPYRAAQCSRCGEDYVRAPT